MDITVREMRDLRDYRACEALQRSTWGDDFKEVVPAAILKIAQKVGGVAAGAYTRDGAMVGFVFGITGWKNGKPCHWSHMLAVAARMRDRGIGQRLKQFQREQLLASDVRVMFWTYDPLVARNAHMNLCRLGVAIDEYVPDMYGADDENSLDDVIGTDRFIVRWNLTSPTPRQGRGDGDAPLVNGDIDGNGTLSPVTSDLPSMPVIRIGIPGDIHALKLESPKLASQWRANTRTAFLHYLGRGYRICGFSTGPGERTGFYELRQSQSDSDAGTFPER